MLAGHTTTRCFAPFRHSFRDKLVCAVRLSELQRVADERVHAFQIEAERKVSEAERTMEERIRTEVSRRTDDAAREAAAKISSVNDAAAARVEAAEKSMLEDRYTPIAPITLCGLACGFAVHGSLILITDGDH